MTGVVNTVNGAHCAAVKVAMMMAKILVIDDEQLTLDMLTAFLQINGHEPISALGGRQAQDKLAYLRPDVILLDIMMPDINGLELCAALKKAPETADLPIIMISAHAPPMIAEAEAAGADGYLAKPINLRTLKEALLKVGVS